MFDMEPRGSRVRGSRRCGLLRRSASASAVHTRTKTNVGLVAVVAVGLLILAGCGGTTNSVTSPTASPDISRGAAEPTAEPTAAPVSCATGGGAADTCVVGDTGPGGGKVFYVNPVNTPGRNYMEAATSATSPAWTTPDPDLKWALSRGACVDKNITGAKGTAIGTGAANTKAITRVCTPADAPAAWATKNYTGGGLAAGSWFLPSKEELEELYTEKATVGGLATGYADSYWSSSQGGSRTAWAQNFDSAGNQANGGRDDYRLVRPVRAF